MDFIHLDWAIERRVSKCPFPFSHITLNLFWNGFCRHLLSTFDLMYRQRICPTIWYWRFVLQKGGNYLRSFCTTFFGPIRRLNFYVLLALRTCYVWRNMLYRICRSIKRHLGQSEDWIVSLLLTMRTCIVWPGAFPHMSMHWNVISSVLSISF